MLGLDKHDSLFVIWAFLLQICLVLLFLIRKTNLELILRHGWVFYLLCIPAVIVSFLMIHGGKPLTFSVAGFIFVGWAVLGITIEYIFKIPWRNPIVWPVFVPYVLLYLGTILFYWFPVGMLSRPLWYVYGAIFAVGTWLNISSH
jgi:hypothetical protein